MDTRMIVRLTDSPLFALGPGLLIETVIGVLLAAGLGAGAGFLIGRWRGGPARTLGGASGGMIGVLAYRAYQGLWPTVTARAEYGTYTYVDDPFFPFSLVAIVALSIASAIALSYLLDPSPADRQSDRPDDVRKNVTPEVCGASAKSENSGG